MLRVMAWPQDGWYLMNEDCYQSCPATMSQSGVGRWGRRCLDPFTCQGGSILGSAVSYGCKCALPDNAGIAPCHICDHRAGEIGDHCGVWRRLDSPRALLPGVRSSADACWSTGAHMVLCTDWCLRSQHVCARRYPLQRWKVPLRKSLSRRLRRPHRDGYVRWLETHFQTLPPQCFPSQLNAPNCPVRQGSLRACPSERVRIIVS